MDRCTSRVAHIRERLHKLRHHIKTLFQMTPRALKYGPKYYWNRDFRRKMRNRESNEVAKRKYGSGYLTRKQHTKDQLITRDGNKCAHCSHILSKYLLTIDHKKKVTEGGTHDLEQLQLLCRRCHNLKDNPSPYRGLVTLENYLFKEAFERALMNQQIDNKELMSRLVFKDIIKDK